MEDVSGTTGITGAVDGIMSIKGRRGLKEDAEERKLLVTGRDIPHDIDIDIKFDAERGGWLTAARQDIRAAILKLLKAYSYMTQADVTGSFPQIPRSRIVQVLTGMKFEHLIVHDRLGYHLPNDFKGD